MPKDSFCDDATNPAGQAGSIPDDLLTLSTIFTRAKEVRESKIWIADRWIQAGKVGLLAGQAKQGKSTTVFDLAVSAASGTDWLGLIPCIRCPVLLLDYENEEDYHADNFKGMLAAKGISPAAVEGMLFAVDPQRIGDLCRPFDPGYVVSRIEMIQEAIGIANGLFVIDTARPAFNDLFDSPDWEMKASPVRQCIEDVRHVVRETGWGAIVIHHAAKSGRGPSGSGDWQGAVDYVINFERSAKAAKLSWTGRQTDPPDIVSVVKADGALVGKYTRDASGEKPSRASDRLRRAILAVLREGRELNTSGIIDAVKADWTKLGLAGQPPGKGKIDAALKAMDGKELVSRKGPRNAHVWHLP